MQVTIFLFSVKDQTLKADVQWTLQHYVSGHFYATAHCPRGKEPAAFRQEAEIEPRFPGRQDMSWSLITERAAPLYDTSSTHAADWALYLPA